MFLTEYRWANQYLRGKKIFENFAAVFSSLSMTEYATFDGRNRPLGLLVVRNTFLDILLCGVLIPGGKMFDSEGEGEGSAGGRGAISGDTRREGG